MKCKALFFIFLLPAFLSAQNLVPNWSFEEYEDCPESTLDLTTGWMSFRVTPDYFNACNESGLGVPYNNFTSYKEALHGEAYSGVVQIALQSGNSEVIAIELDEPLIVDQEYYLSFYASRGTPGLGNCWANKLGAKMSTVAYEDWPLQDAMPTTNDPHVHTNVLIYDTTQWVKIDGYFVADSAFTYLTIGNYFELDSIEIECDQDYFHYQAYYFVDCVCLAVNSNDCPNCDRIVNALTSEKSSNLIYPNPFKDELFVELDGGFRNSTIKLLTISGKLVKSFIVEGDNLQLSISENIPKGLYVLMIEFENGFCSYHKIIKN